MPFEPQVSQELDLNGKIYRIAEHPVAPGIPYGQDGRQAVVYQLLSQQGDKQALKVFKPRFRLPTLVALTDKLLPFAQLPGLRVCQRTILSALRHKELLQQHPDLVYAVLMPWIDGPIWTEVMLTKQALSPKQCMSLAKALSITLVSMEEQGLAHCDLSGPNVLIPALAKPTQDSASAIELVDVEQMFGSGLVRPQVLTSGSFGYAHKSALEGLWSAVADRFAGAVLLAEMLGWCDSRVREAAWGESYFDPDEMQQTGERYRLLARVLHEMWGQTVSGLFQRAWCSETLSDCATFGEWLVALLAEAQGTHRDQRVRPIKEPTKRGDGAEEQITPAELVAPSGTRFPLTGAEISIGRANKRAIWAPTIDLSKEEFGSTVSRRHVILTCRENQWSGEEIEKGAANGTYLNDRRMIPGEPFALQDGDELRLGWVVLTFHQRT